MDVVINEVNSAAHVINKYNFKVLSSAGNIHTDAEDRAEALVPTSVLLKDNKPENIEEIKTPTKAEIPVSQEISQENKVSKSSKDELIESLLQKTDDMSSNFIKMQMKIEAKDDEYKQSLETEKAKSFEEGKLAGIKEAQDAAKVEHDALVSQFSASIQTLDNSTKEFSSSILGIKNELIAAAVDIAKEVILVETSERGNEIALNLAKDLITEIQSSSEVTIKVNPNDKLTLEQSLGSLENIKIVSDNAINNGGVVVVSDAGNIDGDIMKRYERVKNAALGK